MAHISASIELHYAIAKRNITLHFVFIEAFDIELEV